MLRRRVVHRLLFVDRMCGGRSWFSLLSLTFPILVSKDLFKKLYFSLQNFGERPPISLRIDFAAVDR